MVSYRFKKRAREIGAVSILLAVLGGAWFALRLKSAHDAALMATHAAATSAEQSDA